MKPELTIEYCPRCGWLLRAAYMAQEFLTTFSDELKSVQLKPSETSGAFKIFVNEEILFDRKANNGFKDIKELKQIVRDKIAPDKSLGHSDKKTSITNEQ